MMYEQVRADMTEEARVALVSASLARHLCPSGDAIGRPLYWGEAYQIIGEVDDVHWLDPSAPHASTLLGSGAVLVAVALAAAWLPAQRAVDTDPSSILRDE